MSDEHKTQVNLELDEQTAQGVYSNLAIINHSYSEFVIDFASMLPGVPKARIKSRIIMTPSHAKRLLQALQENIQRFESQHQTITDDIPNIGFGPTGQA